jgi:hypothetical protein
MRRRVTSKTFQKAAVIASRQFAQSRTSADRRKVFAEFPLLIARWLACLQHPARVCIFQEEQK